VAMTGWMLVPHLGATHRAPAHPHAVSRHLGARAFGQSVVYVKSTRASSSAPPYVGQAVSVTGTSTGGSVIASSGGASR
jgi:hypothetical protein